MIEVDFGAELDWQELPEGRGVESVTWSTVEINQLRKNGLS
jgi:hypothetical protein